MNKQKQHTPALGMNVVNRTHFYTKQAKYIQMPSHACTVLLNAHKIQNESTKQKSQSHCNTYDIAKNEMADLLLDFTIKKICFQ